VDAKQSFAKTLRELRLEKGLSQEQLAEKAGLSMRMISLLECEKQQPTISTIEALSGALDLKMSELMIEVEKHFEEQSGSHSNKNTKKPTSKK